MATRKKAPAKKAVKKKAKKVSGRSGKPKGKQAASRNKSNTSATP